jgi:arabinogalactan oligomer/maltooligosaccharide transport system permease protein
MAAIAKSPGSDTPGAWDSLKSGLRTSGIPWLFIIPSLMLMLFITFIPQAYQVWISFTDFSVQNLSGNVAPNFIGLENYQDVLVQGLQVPNYAFLPLLGFNIMWTLVNVTFHVVIGVGVALALNAKHVLGRRVYRVIYVLPWALPGYITALIWMNLWQQNDGGINLLIGQINSWFGTSFSTNTNWLGSMDKPINLLPIMPYLIIGINTLLVLYLIRRTRRLGLRDKQTGAIKTERSLVTGGMIVVLGAVAIGTLMDLISGQGYASNVAMQAVARAGAPVLAFYCVLIANTWLGWPFMMVIATGALTSIPPDLYEAADVDGATKWTQFWKITVPMIRPAMVPAIMLGTVWTFNQFNVINFITAGGPQGQTNLLVTQAYQLIQVNRLYGAAAAFAIVVFFVLLVITLINNRITRATAAFDEA